MNKLFQMIVIFISIIFAAFGGMIYENYSIEQKCIEVGGTFTEDGICIKESENNDYIEVDEFIKEYKTVDGKYHFVVVSSKGSPIVNEIKLKEMRTKKVYDLVLTDDDKGVRFQDDKLNFIRLTEKKFYWGHQNVILASGNIRN